MTDVSQGGVVRGPSAARRAAQRVRHDPPPVIVDQDLLGPLLPVIVDRLPVAVVSRWESMAPQWEAPDTADGVDVEPLTMADVLGDLVANGRFSSQVTRFFHAYPGTAADVLAGADPGWSAQQVTAVLVAVVTVGAVLENNWPHPPSPAWVKLMTEPILSTPG